MRTRTAVLLWAAVTIALWAALPLIPFNSHFTWFAWMPRPTPEGPPPGPPPPGMHHALPHPPHPPLLLEMLYLLVMSSIVMAVVLWINSIRTRARA